MDYAIYLHVKAIFQMHLIHWNKEHKCRICFCSCRFCLCRSMPFWVVWHLKQAYCVATAVCWECVHVGIAWIHSFFISLITQSYSIIEQNTFRWSQAISQPIKTPFSTPSQSSPVLLATPFFCSLKTFIDLSSQYTWKTNWH